MDTRRPPIPILADLGDSGAPEQDADVVLFIYRGDIHEPRDRPHTELIIAKQRNGPTSTVYLTFDRRFVRFQPLAREFQPQRDREERHG